MALDSNRLGDAILNRVLTLTGQTLSSEDLDAARVIMRAIADEIIDEFTANGEVAVSVSSVTGVTPGVGVSGPGSGTGTIS